MTKTQHLKSLFPAANGTLALPLGLKGGYQTFVFAGGPFVRAYEVDLDTFGICLTESRARGADVHMPIEDFSIPAGTPEEVRAALWAAIAAELEGKAVFAGCLGGWGRTGLFLSLLARVCGHDGYRYVRAHYTPRAVETREQERYVDEFDLGRLPMATFRAAWIKTLSGLPSRAVESFQRN